MKNLLILCLALSGCQIDVPFDEVKIPPIENVPLPAKPTSITDKKKFKETKVGQFLGAGGKEARQKRRAEREQKRAKKKGKILKEDKAFVQEKEGKTWTQTGGFGETDESGKQVWEWVPNKKSKKSDPFSKKYTYKK